MQKLRVCELFAGVGGFRLGLEGTGHFQVVWSNQWEPATKVQHASKVYEARFGTKGHSNTNIEDVPTDEIPDHDVLVGGFPCQDYSVATTLKNAKGLMGKKGVLWWSIYRILEEKRKKPAYLILENVDRLLKSPSNQRGRDFAVILKGLSDLGYAIEWRVINAADYGFAQRRRRCFIVAYHTTSPVWQDLQKINAQEWLLHSGVLAAAFPVTGNLGLDLPLELIGNLHEISANFNKGGHRTPFLGSGLCVNAAVTSMDPIPRHKGSFAVLADVLQKDAVPDDFFVDEDDMPKWEYLKGGKKKMRTTKEGFQYAYSEGAMAFPDALHKPSRTIITGEGGKTPSRFKHVVQTPKGLRRLTPLELERLNGFPDHHTLLEGITNGKRAFFMGNALVVGVVEKIGGALVAKHRQCCDEE